MVRYIRCVLLPVLTLLCGCGRVDSSHRLPVAELTRELDATERRPPAAFRLVDYQTDGVTHPSVAAAAPSRLIWQLPLPRRGVFHTFVALDRAASAAPIRFRFGVSDDRIYEGLAEVMLGADSRGWSEMLVDLSAYAGWKWSLFYRPNLMRWRLVLSADAIGGQPAAGVWGAPEILADRESGLEYARRRRRIR